MLLLKNGRLSITGCKRLGRCKLRLIGLLILVATLALVAAVLVLSRVGYWLAQPQHVALADAIVVLSGSSRRIEQAIRLYQQGLAPELWHTGDVLCPEIGRSHAQDAAQMAIEHGVPADAIHLLATRSTWEDGQEILALAQERQVQSILVVTDWWHSRRALCVIKQQLADSGIAIYYAPSQELLYGPENWWRYPSGRTAVLREVAKIGVYWMRHGVTPWGCGL